MIYKRLIFAVLVINALHFYGCAQKVIYKAMQSTTTALINNLKDCDTSAILKMYDSSFIDLAIANNRAFVKESMIEECYLFKKILNKHELSNLTKFIYTKDSSNGANIVVVPLIVTSDSELNLEKCDLVVIFFPDKFFNTTDNKFIRFYIAKKQLRNTTTDKIKLPPALKN